MKYSFRISIALLTFLLGIGAFLLLSRSWYSSSLPVSERNLIQRIDFDGNVSLRFLECAGKRAVFLLENTTDHPIYARVRRVDFWNEFKEANLQYGVHTIEYKTVEAQNFEDVSDVFDAPGSFQIIVPRMPVRYGVDIRRGPGGYRVTVPYIEDVEVARRLDEDFASIIKQDFERVRTSWKRVSSDVVTSPCQ
jgi:hypothetical protein